MTDQISCLGGIEACTGLGWAGYPLVSSVQLQYADRAGFGLQCRGKLAVLGWDGIDRCRSQGRLLHINDGANGKSRGKRFCRNLGGSALIINALP